MAIKQINLNIWVTQAQFATDNGYSVQQVNNWIRRGNIKAKKFPEMNNMVLVDKTSLKVRLSKNT